MCEGVSDQAKWCCPTWTWNPSWSPGTVTSFTLVTWFMMWHGFSFCWYYVWYLFTVVHGCWQRGIVIAGTSIHPMVDPGLLLLSNSCSTLFSISWSALLDKGEQSVQLASLNFGQRKMLACVLIIVFCGFVKARWQHTAIGRGGEGNFCEGHVAADW